MHVHRKHTLADDKADLKEFKERFLLGACGGGDVCVYVCVCMYVCAGCVWGGGGVFS